MTNMACLTTARGSSPSGFTDSTPSSSVSKHTKGDAAGMDTGGKNSMVRKMTSYALL